MEHDESAKTELVAKFGSEQQMLVYISYATLRTNEDGTMVFEQKTPLTDCSGYSTATDVSEENAAKDISLNTTTTML